MIPQDIPGRFYTDRFLKGNLFYKEVVEAAFPVLDLFAKCPDPGCSIVVQALKDHLTLKAESEADLYSKKNTPNFDWALVEDLYSSFSNENMKASSLMGELFLFLHYPGWDPSFLNDAPEIVSLNQIIDGWEKEVADLG